MTATERVEAVLHGQPVDKHPNTGLIMLLGAKEIDVPFGAYVRDYRLLTRGLLHCQETYDMDTLCVISDPMRETECLGAQVYVPENDVPYCPVDFVKTREDIDRLTPKDPSLCGATNDRLEAVRFLKERVGNDIPVVGWVEGALAESCDLMGISNVLSGLLTQKETMHQLLAVCTQQAILFAKAQIEAGAYMIGVGDAAASLIGPMLYEEFALPYQKQLIDAIHQAGAKAKLHICGNTTASLHLMAQTGADIVDLDHMVSLDAAAQIFPEEMAIYGHFDPVQVMLQGDETLITSEILRCHGTNHRIFVAPGCEIPRDTPAQNLYTVANVLATLRS